MLKNNKGYTLISSLALGSLMMGTVGMSLLNSNKYEINTKSDEWTKQALANAESKITQFMSTASQSPNKLVCGDLQGFSYNYNFSKEEGELIVIGNSPNNKSTTKLKVLFPIISSLKTIEEGAPALLAKDFNVQQSDIYADSIIKLNPPTTNSTPPICSNPNSSPLLEIGATKNSIITGKVSIKNGLMPNIPDIPENSYPNDLGNLNNKKLNLPRPDDIISENNTYYYLASDIKNSNFKINGNYNVKFYISGDISLVGNNGFYRDSNSNGKTYLYGDSQLERNWLFSGTSCVNAFIHAPNANVGLIGGGKGCSNIPHNPNIYGVVWAKSYNVIGNPSNSTVFSQDNSLLDSPETLPYLETYSIKNISSYQRLPL